MKYFENIQRSSNFHLTSTLSQFVANVTSQESCGTENSRDDSIEAGSSASSFLKGCWICRFERTNHWRLCRIVGLSI